MRLYLDACCLCRPFDEPSQPRIRLEISAVHEIFRRIIAGTDQLISSHVLEEELSHIPDPVKRKQVFYLLRNAKTVVPFTIRTETVARQLVRQGISFMDALHVASAEMNGCDVFLTTDDILLRKTHILRPPLRVCTNNPALWIMEIKKHDREI